MKLILPLVPLLLCALVSCIGHGSAFRPGLDRNPGIYSQDEWMRREIDVLVSGMTLSQKSSQVLMTGIDGRERFTSRLFTHFDGVVPGAVLLFGFNIGPAPETLARFLDSCDRGFESLDATVPVMFAIDHEGGDVYRTGKLTTRLPSAREVASRLTPLEAEALYHSSGTQLSLLGIHLNLAPVAEQLSEANGDFLGTRAFSSDPATVASYTAAAVAGYRAGGVLTALKHFPGNGRGDPHTGLPSLDIAPKEFEADFLRPFRPLLALAPDAVLVSHITVTAVESGVPFCLSRSGVQGILRDDMGFDGLVLTDDLAMQAIVRRTGSSPEAAVLAIKAGCDMVMTSDRDIRAIASAIRNAAETDPVFSRRLDEAVRRILEAKLRSGLVKTSLRRYSDSRSTPRSRDRFSFDRTAFEKARIDGDKILEEHNDD